MAGGSIYDAFPEFTLVNPALDWIGDNVAYPVTDFFYNAENGTLSPHQLGQLQSDTTAGVKQAGGSDADAADAANQVSSFVSKYWSGRSALGTLWDDVKGDPLGLSRAPDYKGQGTDWTWAIVIGIAVVLLFLIVQALLEH